MKRFVITAGLFLFAGSAFAADMAVKAPPRPVTPVLSWTGCYLGIEGGGAWGREPVVATTPAVAGDPVANPRANGGLFGGTIGCNYQVNNIVIGVENDLSWQHLSGTANDLPPFAVAFTHGFSSTWLDTLRGRAGVVVDKALLYITGGAAFSKITDTATGIPATVPRSISQGSSVTGWTIGGGIEYMLAPQWSVKAEYLYVRFPQVHDGFVYRYCWDLRRGQY